MMAQVTGPQNMAVVNASGVVVNIVVVDPAIIGQPNGWNPPAGCTCVAVGTGCQIGATYSNGTFTPPVPPAPPTPTSYLSTCSNCGFKAVFAKMPAAILKCPIDGTALPIPQPNGS